MNRTTARFGAWVRHGFSALVILGLIAYLWEHRGDIGAGMSLSLGQLSLLITLILMTWVLNSLPMLVFARLMQLRLGFWDNLAVLVASTLGNYLPMRVGTVIRMRFFKKVHDLDYTAFVGIMGLRILLLVFFAGALGCVGLAGLSAAGHDVSVPVALVFAGMAILGLLALLVPLPGFTGDGRLWGRMLRQLANCHSLLRTNPGAFALLILITFAQFTILGLRLYVSFQVFGLEVSIWVLLLMGPITTLITFINITPGNLGVREWIIGGLAGITGLNFQNGVFAGTLDRSVLMVLTFVIGPICLYYTLRKTNDVSANEASRRGGEGRA